MSVSNLTNTYWRWNTDPTTWDYMGADLLFESNGNSYEYFYIREGYDAPDTLEYDFDPVWDSNNGWLSEDYREFHITGGDDVESSSVIELLENAAVQFTPPVTYTTTSTELTSIADAIRAKGGTSAPLVYPAGFVSAINDISAGGGGATHVTSTATIANYVYLDEDGSTQTFSADPFTTLSVDALSGSIIVGYSQAQSVSKMQPTNTTLVASSTGGAGNTAYLGIYQVD